jgi:cell division protein FtsB
VKRLIFPALIGLSVYFALFGGEYSVFEVRRVRAERVELEARLFALEQTNECLRGWAEALQSDSATIERLARERYGMIRQGEVLYRITEPADSLPENSVPKDFVTTNSVGDSECR